MPVAKIVNDRVLQTYKELNEVLLIIKDNCAEDEFKYFRRAFAQIMGTTALDVLNVIHYHHPHLRPPELTSPPILPPGAPGSNTPQTPFKT